MLDYCQCSEEDREDRYCNSLSTYAADCASNGVWSFPTGEIHFVVNTVSQLFI